MKKCVSLLLILILLFCALPADAEEAYPFTVYFLDVGQGDCAVVIADGHAMIIDGGAPQYSSHVYRFLEEHGIDHLDYLIATHPDSDHAGGLAGALNYATADKAFCTVKQNSAKFFQDLLKQLKRIGTEMNVPEAGDTFMLGSATVRVLMPVKGAEQTNNTSIVLRICYGSHAFLFMGDCEEADEQVLLNSGSILSSNVLKVAHHGSSTSTGVTFLTAVNPDYAVISVGRDNDYYHPTRKTLNVLSKAGVILYRTDMHGTIVCQSDGVTLHFSVEKNADKNPYAFIGGYKDPIAPPLVPPSTALPEEKQYYVVNTNPSSMKFHKPTCKSVKKISEKNKWFCDWTREELIKAGYEPCGNCKP